MQLSRCAWLLALVAACHGGPRVVAAPYGDRPASAGSTESTAEPHDSESIEIVNRLLNLRSLDSVTLPPGYRELRIADSFGMIAGTRIPVLRIVQGPAGTVGELAFYWSKVAWDRPDDLARCAANRRGLEICAKRVPLDDMDWNAVAARLDSLGA